MPPAKNDLKKILGQYDSLGLYCSTCNGIGLENDCKLTKLTTPDLNSLHYSTAY